MQLFFIVIGNLIAKKKLFGSLIVNRNFNCFKKKPIAQGLSIELLLNYQTRASGTFESVNKMSKGKREYKSSQAEQKVHQIKTFEGFPKLFVLLSQNNSQIKCS